MSGSARRKANSAVGKKKPNTKSKQNGGSKAERVVKLEGQATNGRNVSENATQWIREGG